MKRVCFVFLVMLAIIVSVGATHSENEWASEPTPLEYFEYRINPYDHIISIENYNGGLEHIWLSGTYEIDGVDYSVLINDSSLFGSDRLIRSAIIGEGIENVPDATFNSCSSLERLYLPSTMSKLDDSYSLLDYLHNIKEIYYGGSHEQWYLVSEFVDKDVLNYIPVYCDSYIEDNVVYKGDLYDRELALSVATKISGVSSDGEPIEVVEDTDIWANEYTPINDFRYTLDKNYNTITLVRYDGSAERIALSPVYTIDGVDYYLVSMGDEACFLSEIGIKSVYIPEGVTYIGDSCFNSCSSLRNIYIPSTVEHLNNSFFDYLGEYQVFFNSTAEFHEERDQNAYSEREEERSNAEDLGESLGRATVGLLDGFFSGLAGNEVITVNIYYGGTEEQWNSLVG